jgi:RHS repeat-associated protein
VDLVFGYTGKLFDETTRLQNNLNRWYDSSTGRWISQDPIGFAAGDANLYRYVGNSPTMATDPNGLAERKVGSYPVKGKGHHVIPVELWIEMGFDPETYKMLDSYRMIDTPTHNLLGHGKKTGYSGFVRSELRERLALELKGNTDGKLSLLEQQAFIKQFIDDVHDGKVKRRFIKDFNDAAGKGTDNVRKWLDSNRSKYPAIADDVAAVSIKGLRVISAEKTSKLLGYITGSTKAVGKFLPFVGAMIAYNQARANGNSPAGAAVIAGLEDINPLPIGYDEFHSAGQAYMDAGEWALENNLYGGRAGKTPLDKQGFPKRLFPDQNR